MGGETGEGNHGQGKGNTIEANQGNTHKQKKRRTHNIIQ